MFLQEFVWFRSSLSAARFEAIWPIADCMRGRGCQQRLAPCFGRCTCQEYGEEMTQRLQRTLETDFPRTLARLVGGDRHHSANQIVAKQVRVELLVNSFGSLAAQMVHLQDDLDTSQMKLRFPATTV